MNVAITSDASVGDATSRLLRTARWRYVGGWIVSLLAAAIGVLFLGTLAYAVVGLAVVLPDLWRWYLAGQQGDLSLGDSLSLALAWLWPLALAMTYVGLYVLPFILTLPVSSPIIALWHAPPRILLLRPFNQVLFSRPLRRMARRDIAPLGHVYTLSDAGIKVPWYIRIPIVLGQFALFSFRARTIRDEKQIKRLEKAVDRTWLRNINWCMSFEKMFAVASSDAHWRRVVVCLLKRSNAVIVDVSDLRDNVVWEIDQARTLGVEPRILYLASLEQADELQAALGAEACASRLFRYGRNGLAERERFRRTLAETVAAGAEAEKASQRAQAPNRLTIAATVAFVVGLLPLLNLAFPAFGDHIGLPRWNPWEDPVYWPGIASIINAEALMVVAYGLGTWILLIVAALRTQTIRFLLVIQTIVLLAAPIGMLDG